MIAQTGQFARSPNSDGILSSSKSALGKVRFPFRRNRSPNNVSPSPLKETPWQEFRNEQTWLKTFLWNDANSSFFKLMKTTLWLNLYLLLNACCFKLYCWQIEKDLKRGNVFDYILISVATNRSISPFEWLKRTLNRTIDYRTLPLSSPKHFCHIFCKLRKVSTQWQDINW